MNWWSSFISANLIGIGSNLDNCGVGIAYGTGRIKISSQVNGIINGFGFFSALLGAYAGGVASHFISRPAAQWFACLLLCAIGGLAIYSAYLHPRISKKRTSRSRLQKSGYKDGVLLGFALSFTNIVSGFSATVANTTSLWSAVLSITVWGYIMVWLGNTLALGIIAKLLGKYSSLIAGLILMGVGIHQVL